MSSQGNDRARDCSIARTHAGAAMEGGSAGKDVRSDNIHGCCEWGISLYIEQKILLNFLNHCFFDLIIVIYWLCLYINICYMNF